MGERGDIQSDQCEFANPVRLAGQIEHLVIGQELFLQGRNKLIYVTLSDVHRTQTGPRDDVNPCDSESSRESRQLKGGRTWTWLEDGEVHSDYGEIQKMLQFDSVGFENGPAESRGVKIGRAHV